MRYRRVPTPAIAALTPAAALSLPQDETGDPKPGALPRRRSRAIVGSANGVATRQDGLPSWDPAHEASVPPKRSRRRSPAQAARAHDAAIVEIRANMASGWEAAHPSRFVALYAVLHEIVYGVLPPELRGEAWWGACSGAAKMLRDEFDGAGERMLAYCRWVWRRERAREKRRRDEGTETRRISWSSMFVGRYLLGDYRVDVARAGKRVNA